MLVCLLYYKIILLLKEIYKKDLWNITEEISQCLLLDWLEKWGKRQCFWESQTFLSESTIMAESSLPFRLELLSSNSFLIHQFLIFFFPLLSQDYFTADLLGVHCIGQLWNCTADSWQSLCVCAPGHHRFFSWFMDVHRCDWYFLYTLEWKMNTVCPELFGAL